MAAVPRQLHTEEGIPAAEEVAARTRAARLVETVLGDAVLPGGLRWSPLGPGWSTDLDVHCRTWPDDRRLAAAGWLPLDALLHSLGHRTAGRWAITEDGRVLAALDLHSGPPGNATQRVLDRCRKNGRVRVREVLELRELHRQGKLPQGSDPYLSRAAAREAQLGGALLASWGTGAADDGAPGRSGEFGSEALRSIRRLAGPARRRLRPRVVVALGGVDGSGKSTLATRLVDDLQRAGVPARRIWIRPGMGSIERVARAGRSLLSDTSESGVRQVARADGQQPRSRRGVFGWSWSILVVLTYLWDVGRAHQRASGVVVYDRHWWDAMVTMRFVYGRNWSSVHHRLIRRLLPRPDLAYHLDVDADLAIDRKRDPIFGRYAVEEQIRLYTEVLHDEPSVHRLDARRTVDHLAEEILNELVRRSPRS